MVSSTLRAPDVPGAPDVPAGSRTQARLGLAASVARRSYIDEKSNKEIGAEFGISRFQVARLLDLARTSGMVSIRINGPLQ